MIWYENLGGSQFLLLRVYTSEQVAGVETTTTVHVLSGVGGAQSAQGIQVI